jgi:Tfp pilus assembly protein PilZ
MEAPPTMSPDRVQRPPRFKTEILCRVHFPDTNQISVRTLHNVSTGGAFIQTPDVMAPGTSLLLILHPPGSPVGVRGRVVHAVDATRAAQSKHPVGVGVAFEDLSDVAKSALQTFLQRLSPVTAAVPAPEPLVLMPDPGGLRSTPRFRVRARVMLQRDNQPEPEEVWLHNLSKGGLFVETLQPPASGSRLTVELVTRRGARKLPARVTHVLAASQAEGASTPPGVGCEFVNLNVDQLAGLQQFLDERAQAAPATPDDKARPQGGVATLRAFLDGVESKDLLRAVQLPKDATTAEARARLDELHALFDHEEQHASLRQATRFRTAEKTLQRIEPELLKLVAANPPRAAAAAPPTPPQDGVEHLLGEASTLENAGRLREARDVLARLKLLAPNHPGLDGRLAALLSRMDLQADEDAMMAAELLADQPDTELDVRARVLTVVERATSVQLLVRGLHLLMRIGSAPEALRLARQISTNHPSEKAAWAVMLNIHQRAGHDREALAAGQALLRLTPQDTDLQQQVERLRRVAGA